MKKTVFVVYGRYTEADELPDGTEEMIFTDREEAEELLEEWQEDDDYSEVWMDREERDVWC